MAATSAEPQPAARILGLLYAFLHEAERRSFLGASLARWLKWLPILLLIVALLARWPLWVAGLGVALAAAVRLLYAKARRDHFVHFVAEPVTTPTQARPLEDNERLRLLATGVFAVAEREEYVLQRPADYWRVPLGDHAIMVERVPGRYLYQFIQAGTLKEVRPGVLHFGRQPRRALEIQFLNTWGQQEPDKELTFYAAGANHHEARFARTIYLSFGDEDDRQAVWQNLRRGAGETINRKEA
jgi:hypothetical protein